MACRSLSPGACSPGSTGGKSPRSSPEARSVRWPRAALAEAFPHPATAWPWPTFGVNIAAAFLLGYFVTRLTERLPLSSYRRPLLGTGLCGGLSTFSTMQVEILKMLDAGAWGLAAGYTAASIAAGYAAIHLATAMVRRVRVRA